MSDSILKESIDKVIFNNSDNEVYMLWHGGEPLLAGIGFFNRVIELQKKAIEQKGSYQLVVNSLQTNGTLIDSRWASFFKEQNFLIGISIDGPQEIHNAFRKNISGENSYERVVKGLNKLVEAGVEFNTLSTVNSQSAGKGGQVYDFLKDSGSHFMQFLPVVAPETPWGIKPEEYGEFLIEIFQEWWNCKDAGNYYVQMFDVALANYMAVDGGLCQFSPVCGDIPVVEYDGKVYTCDHFVNNDNFLGSVDNDISSLLFSGRLPVFDVEKFSRLNSQCKSCSCLSLCYGGCPEHRIVPVKNDFNINYLCKGYYMFFEYVKPYLKEMASHIVL